MMGLSSLMALRAQESHQRRKGYSVARWGLLSSSPRVEGWLESDCAISLAPRIFPFGQENKNNRTL